MTYGVAMRGREEGARPELSEEIVPALRTGKGSASRGATIHQVAAPLSHGSNPNSNMAGRRREDDVNLVTAFHPTQEPISSNGFPHAMGTGSSSGGASIAVSSPATGVRRLTPTECERLQSWPDGWTNPDGKAPDSRRYAACGDGVTATVSEWIGRRILAVAA